MQPASSNLPQYSPVGFMEEVSVRTLRFVVSILLVGLPGTAIAQAKPTVAVLPFEFASITIGVDAAALRGPITDVVLTEFAKNQNLVLVERAAVEDLLTKQKLLVSGRVSDADAVRAGQLLGAQYVVIGSILMIGKESQVSLRVVDVETSTYPSNPAGKRGNSDELLTVIEQLVQEFSANLKLPVRAVADANAMIPVAASLAYSRGLDFEKRGKKLEAKAMYQKALELAPAHADAKAALDRVR